jgi:Fe-Mn family superoxide dismutase
MPDVFKLPDLPYSYDALEPHIDAKTMEIHHSKHHAAYVKNLNAAIADYPELHNKTINEILLDISMVPEDQMQAVINHGGGHANHSLFWELMSPNGGGEPTGRIADEIAKQFGSFEGFKADFKKAAMGRFGSGWTWLVADENGKLSITSTANQDSPLMQSLMPVLGLDVWEHAYYLKHQNKRDEYVDGWWSVVNWKKVNELISSESPLSS